MLSNESKKTNIRSRMAMLVPLPEQFYDVKEVAKLPATRACSSLVALVIYVACTCAFAGCYVYYQAQTFSSEDTLITRLYSETESLGYDCSMLMPVQGFRLDEYQDFYNTHGTLCPSGPCISFYRPCVAETTYENIYFAKPEDCAVLNNRSIWTNVTDTITGASLNYQVTYSTTYNGGTITLPTIVTDLNCNRTAFHAHILNYYLGTGVNSNAVNGTSVICNAVAADQNPPYSCTRTVETKMYETLDILALSFGNTQLLFGILVGLVLGFFLLVRGGDSDGDTTCCPQCCNIIMYSLCGLEPKAGKGNGRGAVVASSSGGAVELVSTADSKTDPRQKAWTKNSEPSVFELRQRLNEQQKMISLLTEEVQRMKHRE